MIVFDDSEDYNIDRRMGLKFISIGVVLPLTIVSTTIGIIVLLILSLLVNNMIVKPLRIGANIVEKIADFNLANDQDDMYLQKYVAKHDEIGKLSREVENMKGMLRGVVNDMSQSSMALEESASVLEQQCEKVRLTSTEISGSMGAVNESVTVQTDNLTTTISEIIDELLKKSNETTTNMELMEASFNETMASVEVQSEAIDNLAGMSQELAAIAEQLNTQAQKFTV